MFNSIPIHEQQLTGALPTGYGPLWASFVTSDIDIKLPSDPASYNETGIGLTINASTIERELDIELAGQIHK
jgi:hypothetical protein